MPTFTDFTRGHIIFSKGVRGGIADLDKKDATILSKDETEDIFQYFLAESDNWPAVFEQILMDAINTGNLAFLRRLAKARQIDNKEQLYTFTQNTQNKFKIMNTGIERNTISAQLACIKQIQRGITPESEFALQDTPLQLSEEQLNPCSFVVLPEKKLASHDRNPQECTSTMASDDETLRRDRVKISGATDISYLAEANKADIIGIMHTLPAPHNLAYVLTRNTLYFINKRREKAHAIAITEDICFALMHHFSVLNQQLNESTCLHESLTREQLNIIRNLTEHTIEPLFIESAALFANANAVLAKYKTSQILARAALAGLRCALLWYTEEWEFVKEKGWCAWQGELFDPNDSNHKTTGTFLRYFQEWFMTQTLLPLTINLHFLEENTAPSLPMKLPEYLEDASGLESKHQHLAQQLEMLDKKYEELLEKNNDVINKISSSPESEAEKAETKKIISEVLILYYLKQQGINYDEIKLQLPQRIETKVGDKSSDMLLSHDLNKVLSIGLTPLLYAIVCGQMDIATDIAIQEGVDIFAPGVHGESVLTLKNPQGQTLLDYLQDDEKQLIQTNSPAHERDKTRRILNGKPIAYCPKEHELKVRRLTQTLSILHIDSVIDSLVNDALLQGNSMLMWLLTLQPDLSFHQSLEVQTAVSKKKEYDALRIREAILSAQLALMEAQRIFIQTHPKEKPALFNTLLRRTDHNITEESAERRNLRVELEKHAEGLFQGLKADLYMHRMDALSQPQEIWLNEVMYNLHHPAQYDDFFNRLHYIIVQLVSQTLPSVVEIMGDYTWGQWLDKMEMGIKRLKDEQAKCTSRLQAAKTQLFEMSDIWLAKREAICALMAELPDFPHLNISTEEKLAIYTYWRFDPNRQNALGETLLHRILSYNDEARSYRAQVDIRREMATDVVLNNRQINFNLCTANRETALTKVTPDGRMLLHYLHEKQQTTIMLKLMQENHFNKDAKPIAGKNILDVHNEFGTPLLNQMIMANRLKEVQFLLACGATIHERLQVSTGFYVLSANVTSAEMLQLQREREIEEGYFLFGNTLYYQRLFGKPVLLSLTKQQLEQLELLLTLHSAPSLSKSDSKVSHYGVISHYVLKRFREIIQHESDDICIVSVWNAIRRLENPEQMACYIMLVSAALERQHRIASDDTQLTSACWTKLREESCLFLHSSLDDYVEGSFSWKDRLLMIFFGEDIARKQLAPQVIRELLLELIRAHENQTDIDLIFHMEKWAGLMQNTPSHHRYEQALTITSKAFELVGYAQDASGRMLFPIKKLEYEVITGKISMQQFIERSQERQEAKSAKQAIKTNNVRVDAQRAAEISAAEEKQSRKNQEERQRAEEARQKEQEGRQKAEEERQKSDQRASAAEARVRELEEMLKRKQQQGQGSEPEQEQLQSKPKEVGQAHHAAVYGVFAPVQAESEDASFTATTSTVLADDGESEVAVGEKTPEPVVFSCNLP